MYFISSSFLSIGILQIPVAARRCLTVIEYLNAFLHIFADITHHLPVQLKIIMFFAFSQVVGGSFVRASKFAVAILILRIPQQIASRNCSSVIPVPPCSTSGTETLPAILRSTSKFRLGTLYNARVAFPIAIARASIPASLANLSRFLHIRIQNLVISAALISAYYPSSASTVAP